jgi:glycosyltransferase involved in cell wall biosynthesis
MSSEGAAGKTILFVSCTSTLYGGERSLLEIVNVMSPAWRPWFVVPEKGLYSGALDAAKYPYDVTLVPDHRKSGFQLAAMCLDRIIRSREASLVHANLHWAVPLVAAASRSSGVPFVAHLRNMISRPFDEFERMFFRNAAAVICISRAVADSACEAGAFSAEERDRIWIIPDARDLARYAHGDRGRIRTELGIGEDTPLIGMIARIVPMKGQHIFLEAAALIAEQIPAARFLLVGDVLDNSDRRYAESLKRRCEDRRLKGRVTFFGYRADVPDILAALDCFAHPSSRGAFVSVLIEAMAMGTPLVVSDVDGIPECVGRDGAAELVGGLEPEVWARAIMEIVLDPARRASMSAAGMERAKRYDAKRLALETERVFEHCFKRPA